MSTFLVKEPIVDISHYSNLSVFIGDRKKMKLIFCPSCQDVLKLLTTLRTCSCGASYGNYREDGYHAVIGGEAVPLGFGNGTFMEALQKRPLNGLGYRFTAFVIPHDCSTIREIK